jgi:hypothetical protein
MKIFNLHNGILHVEDAEGNAVGFAGAADYLKYTGKVLPSEYVISYEPDRGNYTTFDGINTVDIGGNNTSFDEDIDNVFLYQSRKDDPYYAMDAATEREARIVLIMATINNNTRAFVRAYHHVPNNNDYDLTDDVRQQLLDIKSEAEMADDPTSIFPVVVTLGVDPVTHLDRTATANTLTGFKSVFKAILEHVNTTRRTARTLKNTISGLNDTELENWVDPRI